MEKIAVSVCACGGVYYRIDLHYLVGP